MQEITPQQILLPKKVYIGDTAELRCTFNSPDANLKVLISNGTIKLTLDSFSINTDYEIKDLTLAPAGVDFYQLSITFVPWKTGDIFFPPLTIEDSEVKILFQPVNIVSLISSDEKTATALRDTAAPLLLPGTAYKLYGALAAFIIILIIVIRLIVKRESLAFYFKTRRLLKKYKKNKKQTVKKLRQLLSENPSKETSDKTAAESIQKILRNYLEVRFDYPFTKAAASEIMPGFYKATNGVLSSQKEEAFGDIAASFIRTDYIRYSNDGAFKNGEKKEIITNLIDKIEHLEIEENQSSGE